MSRSSYQLVGRIKGWGMSTSPDMYFLGERRPLIGRVRLIPQYQQPAIIAEATQPRRQGRARLPRPDDDNGIRHQRTALSSLPPKRVSGVLGAAACAASCRTARRSRTLAILELCIHYP
jgi:hypothetical protein